MSEHAGSTSELLRAGCLSDALEAAQAALRRKPADLAARMLAAELLALAGNLERTDVVLNAATALDPSAALVVAEFRQLVRAATTRRQVFAEGRVPDFLGEPTESQRRALAALIAVRGGDAPAAAAIRGRDFRWSTAASRSRSCPASRAPSAA